MTEQRETAGITMRLAIEFVRSRMGEPAVTEMLARAGEVRPLAVLEDEREWSSYAQKISLFAAAAEVTGRPDVCRVIGETVLEGSVGASLKIALGLLGSPPRLLRSVAKANGKFSTASSMRAVDVTSTSATVMYHVGEEFPLSHFDCDYALGLLTQVPVLFGLPPAQIEHDQCQVRGATECIYRMRWKRRIRGPHRRGHRSVAADALLGRLRELQATLSDLVATTDIEEVLDAIASRAGSAVNAQRFLLAVDIADGEPLRFRSDGFGVLQAENLAGDLLSGRTVELPGHHMLTADVRTSTRAYGQLAAFAQHQFLDHEADLLQSYAGLAATALEAVTALAEADHRRRTAEALLELAGHLHRAQTRADIAGAVASAAQQVVSADVSSTMLFDDERDGLQVMGHAGWPEDLVALLPQVTIRLQDTPELGELLASPNEPRIYGEDCADPFLRSLLQSFRTKFTAVMSIRGATGLHGVLIAGWFEGSPVPQIGPELFEGLRALADQATNSLDKAELMAQVQRQAASDPLTGIANRRTLSDQLEEAMRRPGGPGRPALLFIDLDGFKQVNDSLGHAAGDELLQAVAQRLRHNVRTDDLVARLGGDEFTVLLPSVSGPDAALDVAYKLMEGLAEPLVVGRTPVDVRCSIGVVLIDPDRRDPSDVLCEADAAMYEAKKSGGNRCALFDSRDFQRLA